MISASEGCVGTLQVPDIQGGPTALRVTTKILKKNKRTFKIGVIQALLQNFGLVVNSTPLFGSEKKINCYNSLKKVTQWRGKLLQDDFWMLIEIFLNW